MKLPSKLKHLLTRTIKVSWSNSCAWISGSELCAQSGAPWIHATGVERRWHGPPNLCVSCSDAEERRPLRNRSARRSCFGSKLRSRHMRGRERVDEGHRRSEHKCAAGRDDPLVGGVERCAVAGRRRPEERGRFGRVQSHAIWNVLSDQKIESARGWSVPVVHPVAIERVELILDRPLVGEEEQAALLAIVGRLRMIAIVQRPERNTPSQHLET